MRKSKKRPKSIPLKQFLGDDYQFDIKKYKSAGLNDKNKKDHNGVLNKDIITLIYYFLPIDSRHNVCSVCYMYYQVYNLPGIKQLRMNFKYRKQQLTFNDYYLQKHTLKDALYLSYDDIISIFNNYKNILTIQEANGFLSFDSYYNIVCGYVYFREYHENILKTLFKEYIKFCEKGDVPYSLKGTAISRQNDNFGVAGHYIHTNDILTTLEDHITYYHHFGWQLFSTINPYSYKCPHCEKLTLKHVYINKETMYYPDGKQTKYVTIYRCNKCGYEDDH
jgi:hypothetical protein